ncbi:MAG: acyl-CoA thioesterase-1 [Sulfurimonas sp.]|jgi:acyl-CoA thioesterase-1|uniref:GDSL-type esterase/lipase family protein n=1 Tax=Sulfurimonas sp. TaxID=2022749 RepID=UPI0039E5BB6D
MTTPLILAFGDSTTFGYGAKCESSYPRQIEKKTGLKVINAGVTGEASSQGLKRLPSSLQENPDLVILCHGTHDLYNRRSTTELKDNLLAMIKLIQENGAKILLVGIPNFGLLSNDIHSLYNEVAAETGVLFEENILRNILTSNLLKTDYIHPNAAGYEMMADAFIEILQLTE